MDTFKMAWRNIWRNRRRSTVTVGAMSLALFAMIQYSGLYQGYITGMERNILDNEMGDIQIFSPTYQDNPSIYTRIENVGELLQQLDGEGVFACARLLAGGLAAAEETSAGVTMIGVDVARDAQVSKILRHVKDGHWLRPEEPKSVVIGRRLAHTLNLAPGKELVVLSQGADGSMANEVYRVRGVLKGVSDMVDRTGVFMLEPAFRELMVIPQGAHQIIVRLPEEMDPKQALARIRALAPKLDVKSWGELLPTLASMLESSRATLNVMFVIVYIAIGIVILNAMLMAVFERIREIGVLKALGVGPGGVWRLIMLESAMMTGLAVFIGTITSYPMLTYLSTNGIDMGKLGGASIAGITWDPIWRASVNSEIYVGPIVTLVVIVMLAVFYPAFKAAKIQPVEAIYHH